MKSWRKPLRKRLPQAVVGLWLSLLVAGLVSAAAQVDPAEAAFRRVSDRLLCQCGCHYMVLSCNHMDCSSATYIRRTIRASLAEGKTEDAIVASFVEQYGVKILPEPPKEGFAWMAWIMPFLALALGGGAVSYVLWNWKSKSATVAPQPGLSDSNAATEPESQVPAAVVEKYRAQIDRELEEELQKPAS